VDKLLIQQQDWHNLILSAGILHCRFMNNLPIHRRANQKKGEKYG